MSSCKLIVEPLCDIKGVERESRMRRFAMQDYIVPQKVLLLCVCVYMFRFDAMQSCAHHFFFNLISSGDFVLSGGSRNLVMTMESSLKATGFVTYELKPASTHLA